jgi:hypothetical protein
VVILSVVMVAALLHALWLHHEYAVPLRDALASDAVLFLLYLLVAAVRG